MSKALARDVRARHDVRCKPRAMPLKPCATLFFLNQFRRFPVARRYFVVQAFLRLREVVDQGVGYPHGGSLYLSAIARLCAALCHLGERLAVALVALPRLL